MCFNCDEPYAPGHTCACLFYLETVDDAEVEALTAELDATTLSEAGVMTYGPVDATAFVVSLHAMAGIKTAKTMLLPVTINGERLTALVDTGSTHNFLSRDAMRRLALQPAGAEKFSVTVTNGDRLTCHGVARQVPVLIGDEPFSINCVGIDLGCYDFILGVDFLSTLGPILWDFAVLSLIFWREGGRHVQWTGIGASGPANPQLHPHLACSSAPSSPETPASCSSPLPFASPALQCRPRRRRPPPRRPSPLSTPSPLAPPARAAAPPSRRERSASAPMAATPVATTAPSGTT